MDRYFCLTEDGSITLFVPDIQQHYHSIHGAIGESMHVFIHAGLIPLMEKRLPLQILEVGMGTGLNVLLTEWYSRSYTNIYYTAIEAYPLNAKEVVELNFNEIFPQISKEILIKIHQSTTNNLFVDLRENFFFKSLQQKVQDISFESNVFDLVYFDAFSPDVQPELWEFDLFANLYHSMKNGGIITTYCAKGVVRRRLQEAGFIVERLPGFSGKREMLKATK